MRVKNWISKGAQVTPTVHNYLLELKVLTGKKINVLPRKSPPKVEEAPAAKDAAAPAAKAEAPAAEAPKAEVAAEVKA